MISTIRVSKHRFLVLEAESVEDNTGAATKSLTRFSLSRDASLHDSVSYRTTSSSSKHGRITGSIALTNIGHSIQDLGATYRKSIESKQAKHQDLMAQLSLQMSHQEQQLELQGHQLKHQERQKEEEHQERQDRFQKRQEAMELAQGKETYLPDEDFAALFDVFQKEEGSALAYLSIKTEGVRKAWVKCKIASVMLPPQ